MRAIWLQGIAGSLFVSSAGSALTASPISSRPDTDRVEDQPVGEVTALPMGGDGGDGLG